MSRDATPEYVVVFYVEAESQEALEAAVAYVMKRLGGGAQAYVCAVEVEWGGGWLAVKACAEYTAYAVAKLLVTAYTWLGGKAIQVVRV